MQNCEQWRIQNFIMGADSRSRVRGLWGEGRAPPQKKHEFLPEIGGFWCILGLLFTFMQKLVRSMGAAASPPPLNPPLDWEFIPKSPGIVLKREKSWLFVGPT